MNILEIILERQFYYADLDEQLEKMNKLDKNKIIDELKYLIELVEESK